MWPFKKKEKQEETKSIEEIYKNVNAISVFECTESPWRIVPFRLDNDCYIIEVFRLDLSYWKSLCSSSKLIIGVTNDEYCRIMKELFQANIFCVSLSYNEAVFDTIEQAQKVIDELSPYYDSYHTPRAIMNRLTCYEEDGYPPYFIKYSKEQGPAYSEEGE